MIITMRGRHFGKACTAISGLPHLVIGDIYGVGVLRVGKDVRVIPGPVNQIPVWRNSGPAVAVIFRAVKTGIMLISLDKGEYTALLCRRNRDTHLAQHAGSKAGRAGDVLPAVTTIHRAEHTTSRPTAGQVPELPSCLPECCKQHARICRVHGQIYGTGISIHLQHCLPCLSAIGRPVNTALLAGPEGIAKRRHIDQIGIVGMHPNLANLPGFLKTQMLPAATRIG